MNLKGRLFFCQDKRIRHERVTRHHYCLLPPPPPPYLITWVGKKERRQREAMRVGGY